MPIEQAGLSDFNKLDIRVGKIVRAEDFPRARKPSYRLWIDLGELGIKKSSAQITAFYSLEELVGKFVVAVVNFPPKYIANFASEVLILGATMEEGGCVLLGPDRPVKTGTIIS